MEHDLRIGLDAFAEQFRAQVDAAGPPGSEHAVHFCLALGLQAAWGLRPGTVVFERPVRGRGRLDLWIRPPADLSIEVKYLRPIPSGRSRPHTQMYGSLLADLSKVLSAPSGQWMVVLVSDARSIAHMAGPAGGGLLPFERGAVRAIPPASIATLPATARVAAEADGPWRSLSVTLTWDVSVEDWRLYAWVVEPMSEGEGP